MKLNFALIAVLACIVVSGNESPAPSKGRCIRGEKINMPLKNSVSTLPKVATPSYQAPVQSTYQRNKPQTSNKKKASPKPKSLRTKPKSAPKGNTMYLNAFESDCFRQHNVHRRSLVTDKGKSVPEFKWRKDLAEKAQIWADKLVERSIQSYGGIGLEHSNEMNWGFGENLYSTKNGNQTCACATDAWFNEWPLYNNQVIPEGDFKGYGHFTQLAWADTKYIGCAYGQNGDNIRFTVCEYDPPGNIKGVKLNVFVKGKQVQ